MSGHSIIDAVSVKLALSHCLPKFKSAQEEPKIKSGFLPKAFAFRGENVANLRLKNIDNRLASPSKLDVLTRKAKKKVYEVLFKTYILFSHLFEEIMWDNSKSPSYTNIANISCW